MRLLIVSQYFWPENFKINDLAEALHSKGHSVTILTGKPNYPEGKFYKNYGFFSRRKEYYKGIEVIRVPLIPRGNSSGLRLAINYLSFVFFSSFFVLLHPKRKFDSVFVFATSPITVAFPAILYKRMHKVKVHLWVLDLWPESVSAAGNIKSPSVHKILTRMVRYIYTRVDKILISSRGFKKSIEEKGISLDKIHYIPNWAEEIFENPTRFERHKFAHLMPVGFKVMFTGNIGEAQDCESILGTAEMLSKNENNVKIVMVGDGRKREWFENSVKQKGLTNVCFLGRHPLSEMPHIIGHADLLLVSLKDEPIFRLTVPAKVQAYLASSKPIVAMLNGEGCAVVSEANAGATCPAGDACGLADILQNLSCKSVDELKRMGALGRLYYDSNFKREKILSDIEALLNTNL